MDFYADIKDELDKMYTDFGFDAVWHSEFGDGTFGGGGLAGTDIKVLDGSRSGALEDRQYGMQYGEEREIHVRKSEVAQPHTHNGLAFWGYGWEVVDYSHLDNLQWALTIKRHTVLDA